MDHVIELADRAWFKRCRRAWDLGAAPRRNLEPARPAPRFDLEAALAKALGAYYYPAMSGWSRALVRPIALESYHKAARAQRVLLELAAGEPAPQGLEALEAALAGWDDSVAAGRLLLERYFDWAPRVDDFTAVRADAEFDVLIPNPDRPGEGILGPDGAAVRLRGRIDLLVSDEHNRLWLVQHRLIPTEWPEPDVAHLDDRSSTLCWAAEDQYVVKVSGVIFNEMRLTPGGRLPEGGDPFGQFRRTRIRKPPAEMRRLRQLDARVARAMLDPGVVIVPSPSLDSCQQCPFVQPCLALQAGEDPAAILAGGYRERVPQVIPLPPRTGSCGPQRVQGWKTRGP